MDAYSGAEDMRQQFVHQSRERVRQGGASVDTYVTKRRVEGILVDANARMINLAAARSQQVSHELLVEGAPFAKSGDRFVLAGPPQDRFFYVQTFEQLGPKRYTSHAVMERLS